MHSANSQEIVCCIMSPKWIFTVLVLSKYIYIYKCIIIHYLSLLSLPISTSSCTIPKCAMFTKCGIFCFCGVVFSMSFSNFHLLSSNSSFLLSNSCIFFDNAFLYTKHRFPVSSNIFSSKLTHALSKTPIVSSNSF